MSAPDEAAIEALPTGEGGAVRIEVRCEDGLVGVFHRRPDGWVQSIAGMTVTGYDPANVMRVLGSALGTREVAEVAE